MKEKLIDELTLLDTSLYRCYGKVKTGSYTHEPTGFRAILKKVYNNLTEKEVRTLLTIKRYKL
jgi:hypothetical protein